MSCSRPPLTTHHVTCHSSPHVFRLVWSPHSPAGVGGIVLVVDDTKAGRVPPGSNGLYLLHVGHPCPGSQDSSCHAWVLAVFTDRWARPFSERPASTLRSWGSPLGGKGAPVPGEGARCCTLSRRLHLRPVSAATWPPYTRGLAWDLGGLFPQSDEICPSLPGVRAVRVACCRLRLGTC